MSNPLPLRLCCLAAMAPALTEAATQARVKLSTPGSAGPGPHKVSTVLSRHISSLEGPTLASKPDTCQKTTGQLVTLPKDLLTQRLAETTHLATSSSRIGDNRAAGAPPKGLSQSPLTLIKNLQGLAAKILPPTNGSGTINAVPSKGMSLPSTSTETNHLTGQDKMPRGGGFSLASATKTASLGFTSKITQSENNHKNPPLSSLHPPSNVLPPVEESTLHASSPDLVQSEEQLQIQDVGNSLTIHTADSVNIGAGMSDVGVLMNVDLVAETSKRQKELEMRCERLRRHLRRLQGKHAVAHIQKQLNGLVDHQHQNLQSMAKSIKVQPSNMDLKTELLQSEDVKSLSTAALVDLVVRLQSSHSLSLRQRLTNPSSPTSAEASSSILKLDEDLCAEMNRVSSTLQGNLHHLENAIDSDATESSSGGESCDEDFDLDDEKLPRPKLQRRSEWKWPMERAAVAARWTWLQAQVSDLEYRIRQQTDIYRQIRAGKGAVVLGDPPAPPDLTQLKSARTGRKLTPLEEKIANLERKNTEMSPCNLSTLLSNVDKQSSRLTQQLGNVYSPQTSPLVTNNRLRTVATTSLSKTQTAPNGFVDVSSAHASPGCSTSDGGDTDSASDVGPKKVCVDGVSSFHFDPPSPVDITCQAARCRPVRSYGKRKLLRTAGIQYMGNRKAARLSTVKCRCYPPVVPCAMCGGRYNNCVPLHPDTMPYSERIALLDHSYHQVLSFSQDTPLTVHFEALLKSGEWQHKPPPRLVKPLHASDKKRTKMTGASDNHRQVRRYNRKLSKSATAAMLSSAKIRSKYDHKQLSRSHSGSLMSSPERCRTPSEMRKRKAAMSAIESMQKRRRNSSVSALPNGYDSHHTFNNSQSSSNLKDLRRRRGESAFDINNIVIPYSMAASTRVEKLQYKEILTPSWRKVTVESAQTDEPSSMMPSAMDSLPAVTAAGESDHANPNDTNCDKASISNKALTKESDTANNKLAGENGVSVCKSETKAGGVTPSSLPGFKKVEDSLHHVEPFAEVVSTVKGSNDMIIIRYSDGQEWEVEDISEELIAERHKRCEILEKKRFTSVVHKRSRNSRIDSKIEQGNPEADTLISALQTPPSTPASTSKGCSMAEDSEDSRRRSGSCSSRTEEGLMQETRRRMSSASRSRSMSMGEDRYKMEPEYYVEAWESRTFPLSDEVYNELFKDTSSVTVQAMETTRQRDPKDPVAFVTSTPDISNPCSPHSSTSSEVIEEDDPNDPEWTVVQGTEKIPQKMPAIVLKLAKR